MSLVRAIRIINGQSPAYSHASVYGGAESDAHGDAARIPDFFRAPAEVCFHHFHTDAANCAPRVACPEPALAFEVPGWTERMTAGKTASVVATLGELGARWNACLLAPTTRPDRQALLRIAVTAGETARDGSAGWNWPEESGPTGPNHPSRPTEVSRTAVTARRDGQPLCTRQGAEMAAGKTARDGYVDGLNLPRGSQLGSDRPPRPTGDNSASGDRAERRACEGNTAFGERPQGRASWADLPRETDGGRVGKAVTAWRDTHPVLKGGQKHEVISSDSAERRLTRGKDPRQEAKTLDRRQETPDCGERPAPIFAGPESESAHGNETLGRCGGVTIDPADSEHAGGRAPNSAFSPIAGLSSWQLDGAYPGRRRFDSGSRIPFRPSGRRSDPRRTDAAGARQWLCNSWRAFPHSTAADGTEPSHLEIPRMRPASSGQVAGSRELDRHLLSAEWREPAGRHPEHTERGFRTSCSYVLYTCGADRLPCRGHTGETVGKRVRGRGVFIFPALSRAERPRASTDRDAPFRSPAGRHVQAALSLRTSAVGDPAGWRHAFCLWNRRDTRPREWAPQRTVRQAGRDPHTPFASTVGAGPARTGEET